MFYKYVLREIFLAYFAVKQYNGNWFYADKELRKIEKKLGECSYAILTGEKRP